MANVPWLVLLGVGGMFAFIAVYALWCVWAERKASAWIQDRVGPMEAGPHGMLQTLADIAKLLQKEPIIPAAADPILFRLAPLVVFAAVFAGFAAIPFAPGLQGAGVEVGLLFILAIVAIDVAGILMAGWGSNNKYALIGAVRSVAQIVSYEIPAGLCLLAAVAAYGSLDLSGIAQQQGLYGSGPQLLFGVWDVSGIGGFLAWGLVRQPWLLVAAVVFFIAGLAECNRAPFDIPEAESELVSGFHVEYGGLSFGAFFLAEYAHMLLISLLISLLFLGGWHTPLPNLWLLPADANPATMSVSDLFLHGQLGYLSTGVPGTLPGYLWGAFWLVLKGLLLVLVMMWIRWSVPRLRPDQLMRLCWHYLTPIALGAFVLAAVGRVLMGG